MEVDERRCGKRRRIEMPLCHLHAHGVQGFYLVFRLNALGNDLEWVDVAPRGRVYSWERAWHAVHPALTEHGPYLVVLVELPEAGSVRMIGNLLGDPMQEVPIGAPVEAVFEPHDDATPPFTLVQWRRSAP